MIKQVVKLYFDHNLAKPSAAMAYYLTMTFFPLIICLYALFGQNLETAQRILGYIDQFLTPNAAELFGDYVVYVATRSGRAIIIAAVTLLITSASAAIRVVESTIAELQGGHRFKIWIDLVFSFLLALALVLTMYFAFMVMVTGHDMILLLKDRLPHLEIGMSWNWIRFIMLAGVVFLLFWGVFAFYHNGRYRTLPGAALSTAGVVVMTQIFSAFISASARYSLVYGSLASLILLMLWSYMACQIIFVGAAFNVALRDKREH